MSRKGVASAMRALAVDDRDEDWDCEDYEVGARARSRQALVCNADVLTKHRETGFTHTKGMC